MKALLEVEDLTIRFAVGSPISAMFTGAPTHIEAVADVSFSVQPGETYALVGESGRARPAWRAASSVWFPSIPGR